MAPGISFDVTPPASPVDPNRMDIALFVGFLPLRRGEAAAKARAVIEAGLETSGWVARVDASRAALLDLPVQNERRIAKGCVRGRGLGETVVIAERDTHFAITIDGVRQIVRLEPGAISRDALRERLAEDLAGVTVTLVESDDDLPSLVLTRVDGIERAINVHGNPSAGFDHQDGSLLDLPVRVKSLAEVEALFDTGGRLDRVARVRGLGLDTTIEIADDDKQVAIVLDGALQVTTLDPATVSTRDELRDRLAEVFKGVSVTLDEADAQGRRALILTRDGQTEGDLTVYANPSVGFASARTDEVRRTGCPMGVALRSYFANGGREAVIVRMGDPITQFASEAERVGALETLIGGGFGVGLATLTELADSGIPQLPGHYPTRDPWHGLAHLHGLPDVAMVLLPDLAELTATVPPVRAIAADGERPPERFTVCAPEPSILFDGEARGGSPAHAGQAGLSLWSKLAGWAADQTSRITREAMVIAAPPLPADASKPSHPFVELIDAHHPQLQLVAPWIITAEADDMPGRATPPDGLLAGRIAARTLADGAWRTVAGARLHGVSGLLGDARALNPETAPGLSLIGRSRRGIEILSDRTTTPGLYAQANVRRLMALVLRTARHRGETAVFDTNGPRLWRDVAMTLTTLLRRLHVLGALKGVTEADAFTVLCGPETMHQSDIDAGRVIAEVAIRPAETLETIEIAFVERGGALGVREAPA